jgi:hypothetical protein
MIIGAVGALTVNSLDLLAKRASVKGWYSGTAADSEDTLQFSKINDIASMNESFHAPVVDAIPDIDCPLPAGMLRYALLYIAPGGSYEGGASNGHNCPHCLVG